jgi:hypothetical protein
VPEFPWEVTQASKGSLGIHTAFIAKCDTSRAALKRSEELRQLLTQNQQKAADPSPPELRNEIQAFAMPHEIPASRNLCATQE